jgi:hypothetical protein
MNRSKAKIASLKPPEFSSVFGQLPLPPQGKSYAASSFKNAGSILNLLTRASAIKNANPDFSPSLRFANELQCIVGF